MKFVLAATGASGSVYMQRLLARIDPAAHEVHLVLSAHSKQVAAEELPDGQAGHSRRRASVRGSIHACAVRQRFGAFDAMVIVPCSMGTVGRIAAGTSESTILRAADVFLKERRKLILVPRETPWSLIHARNVVSVMEAGALVLPAIPSFYHRPATVEEVVDTVVFRILDHLGLSAADAPRWQEK